MDNEELEGVKFSEFPSQTPVNADEVVGLHSGGNARFSIANIVAAVRNGLASIFVPKTDVGAAGGVASLDSNGKVPGTQLDLSGKQSTITASGILKGDGQGGVTAAQAGTDYQAPLTAGTDYATPAQLADKAAKADLTSIQATGTTNTTGAAIPAGAYFYLNGVLHRAKVQIDPNATFTVNTNCEQVTDGGLNDLKAAIFTPVAVSVTAGSGFSIIRNSSYRIGNIMFLSVRVQATTAHSGTGNYVICTSLPKPLLDSGSGGGTWAYFGTGDDAARRFSLVYSFVNGVAMGEIVAADKAWAVDDKFAFSVVYLANISV